MSNTLNRLASALAAIDFSYDYEDPTMINLFYNEREAVFLEDEDEPGRVMLGIYENAFEPGAEIATYTGLSVATALRFALEELNVNDVVS